MKKNFILLLLITALTQPSRNLFSGSISEQLENELKNTEQALHYVLEDHAHWHRLAGKNYQSTVVAVGVGMGAAIATPTATTVD